MDAQLVVGWMLATGRGAPRNTANAAREFRAAANLGSATALYNLAELRRSGVTVGSAVEWAGGIGQMYLDAANAGCGAAALRIAEALLSEGSAIGIKSDACSAGERTGNGILRLR